MNGRKPRHPGAANAATLHEPGQTERSVPSPTPHMPRIRTGDSAGQAAEIDCQLCRCAVCNAESTEFDAVDAEIVVDTDDTSAVAAERAVCDSEMTHGPHRAARAPGWYAAGGELAISNQASLVLSSAIARPPARHCAECERGLIHHQRGATPVPAPAST